MENIEQVDEAAGRNAGDRLVTELEHECIDDPAGRGRKPAPTTIARRARRTTETTP